MPNPLIRVDKRLEDRVRELAQKYNVHTNVVRNLALLIGLDIITKTIENRFAGPEDLENYQFLVKLFLGITPQKGEGRERNFSLR